MAGGWVRVDLSSGDIAEAERIAQLRQREGEQGGWTANRGTATLDNHRIGAIGEMAAARYLSVPHPLQGLSSSYRHEQDRGGWDVGGYEVRSRSGRHRQLHVRDSDLKRDPTLKLMLTLTHECPVVWIVGWITLGEAIQVAQQGIGRGGYTIRYVPQGSLRSFAVAQQRGHVAELVAADPAFWCELCRGAHALSEHESCRQAGAA